MSVHHDTICNTLHESLTLELLGTFTLLLQGSIPCLYNSFTLVELTMTDLFCLTTPHFCLGETFCSYVCSFDWSSHMNGSKLQAKIRTSWNSYCSIESLAKCILCAFPSTRVPVLKTRFYSDIHSQLVVPLALLIHWQHIETGNVEVCPESAI